MSSDAGRGVPAFLRSLTRIGVGSENGPKISAVRSALAPFAPAAEIAGVAVESGVPEQPVGLEEIMRGARNRARAASRHFELGVGIEDGLVPYPRDDAGSGGEHLNVGCAAIWREGRVSYGFSSAFAYPSACTGPAVDGREPIGELFDRLWAEQRGRAERVPSARSVGNVGKLTLGVLVRAEYARHAVVCALIPLLHPDLYGGSR